MSPRAGSDLRTFRALLPSALGARIGSAQLESRVGRRAVELATRRRRHRDQRIVAGSGAGLRLNLGGSSLRYLTGQAEPAVQGELVRLLSPEAVVYDVGANVGFYALICARAIGAGGRVYAFEPAPENIATLRHNIALNGFDNIEVIERAAAAHEGSAQLVLSRWSLFHRLEGPGFRAAGGRDTGTLEVPTIRIDDLVEREAVRPPSLIKIDVEGAELEVIEGMRETLSRHRPTLVCELHGANAEYVELMRSLGYGVRAIESSRAVALAHYNVHTLATPLDRRQSTKRSIA